jgi:hypothetical protein
MMSSTQAAEKTAAEKIIKEKYVLKRILQAIGEKVTEDSVFDPLWISRRKISDISKQEYVYITVMDGLNPTWVCSFCYTTKSGAGKIEEHFTVNLNLNCNLCDLDYY